MENEMHISKKNEKGFSLIEVIIAMAILAVGILALAKMQLTTIKSNTSGHTVTEAAMLIHGKMEELKTVSDITTLLPTTVWINEQVDPDGAVNANGFYTRRWMFSIPPSTTVGSFSRQIDVEVRWQKPKHVWRHVKATSVTQGNGI